MLNADFRKKNTVYISVYTYFDTRMPSIQITEAEEKLKQKVASLNQQEHEYESLQEEVDGLKDQLEERGQLLHIASSRVTEVRTQLSGMGCLDGVTAKYEYYHKI